MYNYICVCRYVFGVLQKSRQNISKSENVDDYVSFIFFKGLSLVSTGKSSTNETKLYSLSNFIESLFFAERPSLGWR